MKEKPRKNWKENSIFVDVIENKLRMENVFKIIIIMNSFMTFNWLLNIKFWWNLHIPQKPGFIELLDKYPYFLLNVVNNSE